MKEKQNLLYAVLWGMLAIMKGMEMIRSASEVTASSGRAIDIVLLCIWAALAVFFLVRYFVKNNRD